MTPDFKIGRRSVERSSVQVSSAKTIYEDKVTEKKVLGLVVTKANETKDEIFFLKNFFVDNDGRTPL